MIFFQLGKHTWTPRTSEPLETSTRSGRERARWSAPPRGPQTLRLLHREDQKALNKKTCVHLQKPSAPLKTSPQSRRERVRRASSVKETRLPPQTFWLRRPATHPSQKAPPMRPARPPGTGRADLHNGNKREVTLGNTRGRARHDENLEVDHPGDRAPLAWTGDQIGWPCAKSPRTTRATHFPGSGAARAQIAASACRASAWLAMQVARSLPRVAAHLGLATPLSASRRAALATARAPRRRQGTLR